MLVCFELFCDYLKTKRTPTPPKKKKNKINYNNNNNNNKIMNQRFLVRIYHCNE